MLKNAEKGNAAVQIFLAKNMLGMSDHPNENNSAEQIAAQVGTFNDFLKAITTPAPNRDITDYE